MLNEYHYPECRILPAINETFPQFSRPISLLSPLDLSLRAGNIIPITPPTTPSPPRKRQRLMSDENYLWRPHVMETLSPHPQLPPPPPPPPLPPHPLSTATTTSAEASTTNQSKTAALPTTNDASNYNKILTNLGPPFVKNTAVSLDESKRNDKNNLHNESHNSFEEMPESQRSEHKHQQQQALMRQQSELLDTIYLDDDTIILTEDEDETLVSSQDFSRYAEDIQDELAQVEDDADDAIDVVEHERCERKRISVSHEEDDYDGEFEGDGDGEGEGERENDDEDEYVDILSNDDDEFNAIQHQKKETIVTELDIERSGTVLTRNKLVYENEELHNQAVNGLARLFERDFGQTSSSSTVDESEGQQRELIPDECKKIYTNLDARDDRKLMEDVHDKALEKHQQQRTPTLENLQSAIISRPHKTHKIERKRMKMRKFLGMDEETISPVSGTIIRKLRDDEELVVRKGDIDPAFNVVEITEEAKAILASIDNKIGAYLCQLCRTLYDDAFMLAQHRCPRIVHIEYKCSECEKVFNCPANLASHRRWHKPKSELLANKQNNKRHHSASAVSQNVSLSNDKSNTDDSAEGIYPCTQCGKTFRRHAYLKKHQASHQMLENLKSLDIFKHHNTSTHQQFGFSQLHSHLGHTAAAMQQQQQQHPTNTSSNHPHHPFQSSAVIFGAGQRHYPGHYQPPQIHHHHHQQQHQHHNPHNYKSATITNQSPLQRLPSSAFAFPPFDQRRSFCTLGELYLSQQLERSSAFQYVQQANHLRNLSNAVGNLLPSSSAAASAPISTTIPMRPLPMMHSTLMSLPVK